MEIDIEILIMYDKVAMRKPLSFVFIEMCISSLFPTFKSFLHQLGPNSLK